MKSLRALSLCWPCPDGVGGPAWTSKGTLCGERPAVFYCCSLSAGLHPGCSEVWYPGHTLGIGSVFIHVGSKAAVVREGGGQRRAEEGRGEQRPHSAGALGSSLKCCN
jgi:hypothetical protein